MAIQIKDGVFNLKTPDISYIMCVFGNRLLHVHYGKRIDSDIEIDTEVLRVRPCAAMTGKDIEEYNMSSELLLTEYSCYGSPDLRTPAFHAEYEDGSEVTVLTYKGYQTYQGKKPLRGLPSTYVECDDEAETLEITLEDTLQKIEVILSYTVFENYNAIARSVKVKNRGDQVVKVKSLMSCSSYLLDKNYEMMHLQGAWARERHIQRLPLGNSMQRIDSKRGASSHHHSPFIGFVRPYTTEEAGEAYGFSLIYSGNFEAYAETNAYDTVRINMGINSFSFCHKLKKNDELVAPEAVMVYSAEGIGAMSRTFHKLYKNRLCRGKWRDAERPILINNWEATYFEFDENKILSIAQKAKEMGIELLVLDDGWFGKRDLDNCSLGDWTPDLRKLPNGIKGLAEKVNAIGMKFGLWFEPEMVSPDSDLYRAHPDWCIHIESRKRTECRHQLILDLSKKEVQDYIVKSISDILCTAPIEYVKWDMNRNFTEITTPGLPHQYMLGLYSVLERITTAFPEVLFEGCSGGGGRFDAGMLPYFSQYWTSDDTDAIERTYIQYGTSVVMPASTMGAHVSTVPNHQLGRTTPLKSRGYVAMMGQFGYELDIEKCTDQEIEEMKHQITEYKELRELFHNGEMYRLKSPFEENCCAWEFVSEDKKNAVLMYCTVLASCQGAYSYVKLRGLNADKTYIDIETGKKYGGDYLMNVGIAFENSQDFLAVMKRFEEA